MQVIAATQGLLPLGIDIGAQMVLVGRLVCREARIAIEAIGTVLHLQMSNLRVEGHNAQSKIGRASCRERV